MAKRTRARSERRRDNRSSDSGRRGSAPSRPGRGIPWVVVGWSLGGIAVVGLLFFALASQGGAQRANAATAELARLNARTEITTHSGTNHVVYQSDAPLPSAAAPRADGQPTLVWFSATWCHVCEQMAPYAHETARIYSDQLVFVEKSVDHDRESAGRFGVRGTPTFVMLDATGNEVMRFFGAADAASFATAIERALAAADA